MVIATSEAINMDKSLKEHADKQQKAELRASPCSDALKKDAGFSFTTTRDTVEGLQSHIDALNQHIVHLSKENSAMTKDHSRLVKQLSYTSTKYATLLKEQNEWSAHHERRVVELTEERRKLSESLDTISSLKQENTVYLEDAMLKDRKIRQQQAELISLHTERHLLQQRNAKLEQQAQKRCEPEWDAEADLKTSQKNNGHVSTGPCKTDTYQPHYSARDQVSDQYKKKPAAQDHPDSSYRGSECRRSDPSTAAGAHRRRSAFVRSPPRGPARKRPCIRRERSHRYEERSYFYEG